MKDPNMQFPEVNLVMLAQSKVLDENHRESLFGKLWLKQTGVFIFLRHFACAACRAHATQIWGQREALEKGGGKIHFIGNGSPNVIQQFKEELGIQASSLYTDPTLQCFRAAGFKRGFLVSHGPRSLANFAKLVAQGHKQEMPSEEKGDIWQLGGVLAVRPEGKVVYHYISQATGDFPVEDDLKKRPWDANGV